MPEHYDTPDPRAAVEGAIRAELDALGGRLRAFRDATTGEMERLAAFRWLTDLADLRPTEVADRVGVSRQTLINLKGRTADYEWPVDLRVLLKLGLHGPRSNADLSASIARAPVHRLQVEEAVERLRAESLIAVAGRAAAEVADPVVLWRITASGIDDLPRRLRLAAMPPSRTWSAYVVSSPAEANAIADAGNRALGEHGVAVIPAGTVRGMTEPEVAFWVEASDPHSAAAAARALFAEFRERAGMTPRRDPIVVSALVPPRSPVEHTMA